MKNIDRTKSSEKKWNMENLKSRSNVVDNVIPNHIADFDFATPEFIFDGIKERCNFKSLSYTYVDDGYYDAFKFWYKEMKGIVLEKGWINYSHGVVFSMGAILEVKTKVGDAVLINTPCYSPFVEITKAHHRTPILNKLKVENKNYHLDFAKIEKDIIDNNVKVYLFCNPLNPTGRLWTKDELNKLADICTKHNVLLVSDEVHGDLVSYKDGFNTILTVDDKYKNNVIVVSSSGKAFNIAGINTSCMISKNVDLLKLIWTYQSDNSLSNSNALSLAVMKAAYTPKGVAWIQTTADHYMKMFKLVDNFIKVNQLPLELMDMPSGFCSSIIIKDSVDKLEEYKEKFRLNGLLVRFNDFFHDKENLWFRLLLSTDQETVEEMLKRIKKIFE